MARDLINGERLEVLSVGRVNMRIKTQNGREVSLKRWGSALISVE